MPRHHSQVQSQVLSGAMDLEAMRAIALRAALAAAEVVEQRADGVGEPTTKGRGDYVTAVDHAAEAAALQLLQAATPGVSVLAEEGGGERAPLHWAVDPLDGTTNFIRGFPVVGVSVALVEEGIPVVGAVAAPFLGTWWTAALGHGAVDHRGRRLQVREPRDRGIVATGFPFRHPETMPQYQGALRGAFGAFEDLRRAGAASVDLAYTAQGTFDGFFEMNLGLWDIAAGALLVREAGGIVTDWHGNHRAVFDSGNILAGSRDWHERMLAVLAAC